MRTITLLAPALLMTLSLAGAAEPAPALTPREELTEGKLAVDLGQVRVAKATLESLAGRPGGPEDVACEALVRLAALRWQHVQGKHGRLAWVEVMNRCSGDTEAMRLVAEFVTGVEQDPATWRGRTEAFTLVFRDGGDASRPELGLTYVSEEARDPFSAAAVLGDGKAWRGQPVSVSVKDADIVDLFRLFHEVSDLNIVMDPRVKGRHMTLDLVDVPWDQALSLVLQSQGLGASVQGNIMLIAPLSVLAAMPFSGDPEDLAAQQRTLDSMERIAGAAARYRADVGQWPVTKSPRDIGDMIRAADPPQVATMALPDGGTTSGPLLVWDDGTGSHIHAGELPTTDAWGHAIRYWSDGSVMRLVSPGKDGVLEHADLAGYVQGVADRPEDDLAWEDDHALTFLVTPPTRP